MLIITAITSFGPSSELTAEALPNPNRAAVIVDDLRVIIGKSAALGIH
jgi:hypothetical protein